MPDAVTFVRAEAAQQLDTIRRLFRDYQREIGIDLCFQGFEQELAALPDRYAAPRGRLLLIEERGTALGCVALRALDDTTCEMKRLYIEPSARGRGLGRTAAVAIVAEARAIGYARMRLDTLRTMQTAIALYRTLGFREIEPYYDNPIEEAVYMELDLVG